MEEQLINYNTAILAFEKGFDVPCGIAFLIIDVDINYDAICWLSNQNDHIRNYDKKFLRPTQFLLQKWLRKNFNIHIIVSPAYSCEQHQIDNIGITGYFVHIFEWIEGESQRIKFLTYEEALEFGLVKALNSIKI